MTTADRFAWEDGGQVPSAWTGLCVIVMMFKNQTNVSFVASPFWILF